MCKKREEEAGRGAPPLMAWAEEGGGGGHLFMGIRERRRREGDAMLFYQEGDGRQIRGKLSDDARKSKVSCSLFP